MRGGWIVLLLAAQDPDVAADPGAPPPLAPIAGIAGFASVSRLEFADERAPPHRLEAVYLFPGRARWRMVVEGGTPAQRMLVYRFGERAHQLLPGRTASSEFEGADRDTSLLQLELRRAVMIWPDGFPWREAEVPGEEGHVARAQVVVGRGERRRILGTLEARLDDAGRPTRVATTTASSNAPVAAEALEIRSWKEVQGRAWPRELVLYQDGQPVWTETVLRVTSSVYFVDAFFVPPDRRTPGPTRLSTGGEAVPLDLQAVSFRAHELPADTPWDAALERARAWIDEAARELSELGLAVDPVPTLELSVDGHPRRVLVRLAEARDEPPEGWTTVEERPGLALVLDEPGRLADEIGALGRALPAGSRPGTPYCRVLEGPRIQVYLPLQAR